eukprot:m51a1_g12596 hypothetical protein (244) ;mRNA; r:1463-2457
MKCQQQRSRAVLETVWVNVLKRLVARELAVLGRSPRGEFVLVLPNFKAPEPYGTREAIEGTETRRVARVLSPQAVLDRRFFRACARRSERGQEVLVVDSPANAQACRRASSKSYCFTLDVQGGRNGKGGSWSEFAAWAHRSPLFKTLNLVQAIEAILSDGHPAVFLGLDEIGKAGSLRSIKHVVAAVGVALDRFSRREAGSANGVLFPLVTTLNATSVQEAAASERFACHSVASPQAVFRCVV